MKMTKINQPNLKKLGFTKYGDWYQHNQLNNFTINNPRWENVLIKAFDKGVEYGKTKSKREIQKALGL
tara:strand:- start:14027 stop:14230 length:204 start_codon:yes stop_codon:yes gene_type:complete